MAMTGAVKDELSRVDVAKPCCRRSEMAALLRFAGGLHIVSNRVVVEAELDTGAAARRLRREIADVYGYSSEIHVLASGGLRKLDRIDDRRSARALRSRPNHHAAIPPWITPGRDLRRYRCLHTPGQRTQSWQHPFDGHYSRSGQNGDSIGVMVGHARLPPNARDSRLCLLHWRCAGVPCFENRSRARRYS